MKASAAIPSNPYTHMNSSQDCRTPAWRRFQTGPISTAPRRPDVHLIPNRHRPLARRLAARFGLIALAALSLAITSRAEVQGWFLPSTVKVLRDAQPLGGMKEARLAAARNETESVQLVLRSDEALDGVKVTATALQRGGAPPLLQPSLAKVEYVPNIVGSTPYPDPLPPLRGLPFRLEAGQAQPIWISVSVPKDTPAGNYWGDLTVQAGRKRLTFQLNLRVWNFALPDAPASATAFGLDPDSIARQHGVAPGSAAARDLYTAYYQALLDRRISAYNLPVDLMSDEAARYLNDPRLTSYVIPYSEDDVAMTRLATRLVERGWFRKGIYYPIDEPFKKEAYDQLNRIGERLKKVAPGYQWVVPFYRGPDWQTTQTAFDLLAGQANIWCPNLQYFDTEKRTRPFLADRRQLGDRTWWYVCCGPGAPYNNFFVEMPALAHRLLFWQQKRENVGGLLYWNTTWWNPASTTDPWADMATVKDINPKIHGDGSLFYPGKAVGIDGPITSIRLEVIRDGLEDFDYLTLADRVLGRDETLALVKRVAPSLQEYTADPVDFELVRRVIGEKLSAKLHKLKER